MIIKGVGVITSVIQMFELLVHLVLVFIWTFSTEGSCFFSESEKIYLPEETKQHSKQS